MPEDRTFTPKQRRALAALITEGDVSAAAEAAGVSRDTLYRWMTQPDFKAALVDAESEAMENLSRALVRLGDKAQQALEEVLDDGETRDAVKVSAANAVLGHLLKLREITAIEARLAALEARIKLGAGG